MGSKGELIGIHILGTRNTGTTFGFATRLSDIYHNYDDFKHKTSKYYLGIDFVEHEDENGDRYWEVTGSTRKELKKGDKILSIQKVQGETSNSLVGAVKDMLYQGKNIEFKVKRTVVEDGKTITKIEIVKVQSIKKPT